MKVLAIIQARSASTRLPGKVLMKIKGKTILGHVVERAIKSKMIDEVIVATTINKEDLPIVKYCASNNIRVFCGSEDNVLDRFYQAAKLIKPENIVRITADCPMLDYKVIDAVVAEHLKGGYDYTANSIKETYPDGEDVEVFKYSALEKSWKEAKLLSELEHVTLYIKKHPKLFSLHDVTSKDNLSSKRWTVDNPEDFKFVKAVFKDLYPKNRFFGLDEILKLLRKKPQLEKINQHISRNEGLKKSLRQDKKIAKKEK